MEEGPFYETFDVAELETSRSAVLRLLGGGRGRPLRASVEQLLEEEILAARELTDAKAVFGASSGGLPGSSHLDMTTRWVVAICTVGPELEDRTTRLSSRGELARAVVADAVASATTEALADACERRVCQLAGSAGLRTGRPTSPGYGGWPLEEQRFLFGFVDPSRIGVTLNERHMMSPRKSISFVVSLGGDDVMDVIEGGRCERCGLAGCPYRERGGDPIDAMQ